MRRVAAIAILALLALSSCAGGLSRARYVPYAGPRPAPGAISAFDSVWRQPRDETRAGAPPFLAPNSTNPALFKIGTLEIAPGTDSLAIIIYGDNRMGFRMLTTKWGLAAVLAGLESSWFSESAWGLLNFPVALVQAIVPTADLVQDLISGLWTHRRYGGQEKRVLAAIERELQREPKASFVLQTGDVVENGMRGGQWEDFAKRHARLRQTVPYVATVGNHERTYSELGRSNWDAVMGPPARPMRYWYAIDFPDSIARICFIDTNVLADPADKIPDSLETALADEQLAWLDSALAVPARFRFVAFHHPLVTSGSHLSDWQYDDSKPAETRRRGRLIDLCHRRRVTAVFAGHEHFYQRTFIRRAPYRGFWHITTGGGGSPLYRVSDRDRRAALAVTLPDSSKVTWNRARSVHHFSRLTLVRRPRKGEDHIRLDVYEVLRNGRTRLVDHQDLADLPSEASD
jgi:hypothetical protein